MKKLLFLLIFFVIALGAAEYRFDAEKLIKNERDTFWKISGIKAGKYYISIDFPVGKNPGMEAFKRVFQHNGFYFKTTASGFRFENGQYHLTAVSCEPLSLDNGDLIAVSIVRNKHLNSLTLSSEKPEIQTPQMMMRPWNEELEDRYPVEDSCMTPEKLTLYIKNLSGKKRTVDLNVRILDYFGKEVFQCDKQVELAGEKKNSYSIPYKLAPSRSYRAYVTLRDDTGFKRTCSFGCTANDFSGMEKCFWLNEGWEMAEIKDDGTEKTRMLQSIAPADAKWEKVKLPAIWNSHIVFFRNTFVLPKEFESQRYFMHFNRLVMEGEIRINGQTAYRHTIAEGYAPFEFEVTKYLKPGENQIFIAARGRIAGTVQSTILRKNVSVYGEVRAENHQRQGMSEIHITGTPAIPLGTIHVMTSFRDKTITLDLKVPEGMAIRNRVLFEGREVFHFEGKTGRWDKPVLWGPERFPLLQLETTLVDADGKVADVKNTRFGFREIWADGLDLVWNGHVTRMVAQAVGACGWQRYAGHPADPGQQRRFSYRDLMRGMVRTMKAGGVNMLRHQYGDSITPEICDEEGVLIAWGSMVPSQPAMQKFKSDEYWNNVTSNNLRQIDLEFNHPSVFTWYTGNELFATSMKLQCSRITPLVQALTKADPTRFVESGADLDLFGAMKIQSIHYPIPVTDAQHFPPDVYYWRNLNDVFVKGEKFPKGQTPYVGCVYGPRKATYGMKPMIINEYGWIQYCKPPHWMTTVDGDKIYESCYRVETIHEYMNKKSGEGHRDAGASVLTPWLAFSAGDKSWQYPCVEAVIIQEYSSFYTGTKPKFDVNYFRDRFGEKDVELYWSLERNGEKVAGHSERIHFKDCMTVRRTVYPPLDKAGIYTFRTGLKGECEAVRTLHVYDRLPQAKGMIITAETDLDAEKNDILMTAENGGTVLVLPRKDYPLWLPGEIRLSARTASINYTFRPGSPVLKGLVPEQLSYFYPDHKTGTEYFLKPRGGNWRSLVEAGGPNGLIYVGLLEIPYGKGRIIYSRLDLDVEVNPVAAILIRNIFAPRPEEEFKKAALVGKSGSILSHLLTKNGVPFDIVKPDGVHSYPAALVDGSLNFTEAELQCLRTYQGKMIVFDPSEQFGLTFNTRIPDAVNGRAFRIAYEPSVAGVTNFDLFWRKQQLIIQDAAPMYGAPDYLAAPVCKKEITGGARLLTYPGVLAQRGNTLFTTIDFEAKDSYARENAGRILSTLLTNAGILVENRKKPLNPSVFTFKTVPMDSVLDRTLTDETADDGKGGWTDQGAEHDLRKFPYKAGVHDFRGVPFRIEYPDACVVLSSKFRKFGHDEITVPVNAKADALFLLHTCAWTSNAHHYSMIVNYADGTTREIQMIGDVNLRDWGSFNVDAPFDKEFETESICAWSIPVQHETFSFRALYRTGWRNPSPSIPIKSVTFRSMKRAVPVLFALTLATEKSEAKTGNAAVSTEVLSEAVQEKYNNLTDRAYEAYQAKQYKKAIALYEEAIKLAPGQLAAYAPLGACHEALGDYQSALNVYQRSIAVDSNQPDILALIKHAKKAIQDSMEKNK